MATRAFEPRRTAQTAGDQTIVAAVRGGDIAAFEQLFTQHYAVLVRFAASYTYDHALAEEIVGDVFTTLWNRRAGWTIRTSVEAYLFGIVRLRLTDAWRVRSRRAQLDSAYANDVALAMTGTTVSDTTSESVGEEDAVDQKITQAIATLPRRYREIVILRYHREMEYEEIAEALGLSKAAVYQQISRAIKMLRAALGIAASEQGSV
jgi:RNA polymerase sigma-70 factor (ECF subfamily)